VLLSPSVDEANDEIEILEPETKSVSKTADIDEFFGPAQKGVDGKQRRQCKLCV